MPTRFNSKSESRFGVPGLPSGYGGISAPDSLTVPSVGIEDVDVAMFALLDKEIPFVVSVSDRNRGETKKVPVVFGSGEKWAKIKKERALRDKSGSLILPLITAVRTTIQQLPNEDITGRGTNQQTGEIIIKRRLDKSDRAYQNLINRMLLQHQTNLAVSPSTADVGQLTTLHAVGDLSEDPTVRDGGLMLAQRKNNVMETLVVPAPQFFTALYEVTFWTQYTVQMNQLIEQLISSFLPQGQSWRLDTPKGYWFVATVDGNIYSPENNVDDMSQEERIIKYKFTVKVPGYIMASGVPGAPVPVKRYVSSPVITFDIGTGASEELDTSGVEDPFLGSDDPTLPLTDGHSSRGDQRSVGGTRLYPQKEIVSPHDPALKAGPRGRVLPRYKKVTMLVNGKQVTKFVRVVSTNRYSGETVFAPDTDLGALAIVVIDD